MKKSVLVMVLIAAMMMIGCSGNTDLDTEETADKTLVIAGKPMTEQYILVEILTQLIEAKTDIIVEQKQGIGGGTSNIHPAMLSGDIDMYPEYTGTGWLFVLKKDLINDPQALYQAVKEDYNKEFGITWSGLYGFNDTFALAIKKDLAEAYGIKSYSDLAAHSENLRFGAEYDFYERDDGYPGLKSVYGFNFKDKVELDIGLKYEAISSDKVDVINVFSTDAQLEKHDLLVLEDDQLFFPSYFAATLIRNESLERYPELEEILESLTDQISNEAMMKMNYLVEIEKKDPKDVAADFIAESGL